MTITPAALTRKEVERLESSLAIRAPRGVAPEDFARVIHWAWRARVQDRPRDQALLNGVLDGEFEIAVGGPNRDTGPASDRRLMFWTPPPPEVRSHDQVYESHIKYLTDGELQRLTRLRDRWRSAFR